MTASHDLFAAARDAVALVCGVDASAIDAGTDLADLGADSLALVSIADVVEAELAARGVVVRLDDATLARLTTVGDIADHLADQLAAPVG
jgi:acyl carrier protein